MVLRSATTWITTSWADAVWNPPDSRLAGSRTPADPGRWPTPPTRRHALAECARIIGADRPGQFSSRRSSACPVVANTVPLTTPCPLHRIDIQIAVRRGSRDRRTASRSILAHRSISVLSFSSSSTASAGLDRQWPSTAASAQCRRSGRTKHDGAKQPKVDVTAWKTAATGQPFVHGTA